MHLVTCSSCDKELICVCLSKSVKHHCLSCGERLLESASSQEQQASQQYAAVLEATYSYLSMEEQCGHGTSSKLRSGRSELSVKEPKE